MREDLDNQTGVDGVYSDGLEIPHYRVLGVTGVVRL